MATPSSDHIEDSQQENEANIIRRHYLDLARVLAVFPDLLLSLSIRFYQRSFINLHTKSSINRSGGLPGASMLLDHVMMKIEQSDQYIPLVMDILREEVALKDIVEKMEDESKKITINPPKIKEGIVFTSHMSPSTIPTSHSSQSSDDDLPSVADSISSAERLKDLFESLCCLIMSIISTASVDLMLLKLKIFLRLQSRENTPEVQRHLADIQECNKCESVIMFLIRTNLLGYLNFGLLDSIKAILSSDEFNNKLQEYKLAHEQFIKNHFRNIVEVFQQEPNLRPVSVIGLPKIKVRLQNEWRGRSLYDWKEIINDIIQWGQYIMIVDVEMNCVTITYQILPFILPRVITDLTNDTIKKRFTSIGATFIIPEEIQARAMADHKWIMDTIQEQQVMKKTRPNERGEDPVISGPYHTITDQPLEELPPKEGGYNDEIFLTTPPNDLQCPVCHLTLKEPHQLTCCGSILCQVCSERSNAGMQCPCCRDTNHQIMVDKNTRRKVMSLQVKCTVTQCHWTGELLDWNKHTMDKKKCPLPKDDDEIFSQDFKLCQIEEPEYVGIRERKVYKDMTSTIVNVESKNEVNSNLCCYYCVYVILAILLITMVMYSVSEDRIINTEVVHNSGYNASDVPEWSHQEISFLQYEILPVYRTIKHFHKHKQNDEELYTDPFYTSKGGYKVTLGVYPNGYGSGKGTHVSVYINLMKGPNDDNLPFPISGIFTIQLLNWKEDHHHIEKSIEFDDSIPIKYRERVTRVERADGMGYHIFVSHNDVASMNVLYEDMMCFKISYTPITLTAVPAWCDVKYSITPPCTRTMYSYNSYKKTHSIWHSQPFYSTDNGYKLQLIVYANGEGLGKGTHLSLYVYLMKGDYDDTLLWPFNADITVQLLNWSSDNHHVEETIPHHRASLEYRQRVVDGDTAPGGWGYYQFISHTKLQDTSDHTVTYSNNDNICFRITNVKIV